jgi:hypothetical protein
VLRIKSGSNAGTPATKANKTNTPYFLNIGYAPLLNLIPFISWDAVYVLYLGLALAVG